MSAPDFRTAPDFRIAAARLRLMQSSAGLLAEIGQTLEHRPEEGIATLDTNGKTLRYNTAFIAQLTDKDLETALLHEYGHSGLLHPLRHRPEHQPERANRAMDFAVNLWIDELGRAVPQNWLFDARFRGFAWEHIYTVLENEEKPPPPPPPEQPADDDAENDENAPPDDDADADDQGDGDAPADEPRDNPDPAPSDADADADGKPAPGPGKPGDIQGDVQPYPASTPDELSAAAAELTDRIARIAEAHMIAGQGTDGAQRLLDSLTTPRDPDLYEALAQLLERSPNDHTWRRLNKRLLHAGLYPALDGEECPPLVVVIDTSGSISDAILSAFSDKVHRAISDFRPRAVTLIYCDSRINGEPQTYTPDDFPELTPCGGGGTDFRPPFDWVAQHLDGEPPAALVYLTDLEGQAPDDAPDYPVIWAAIPSTYATIPNFGQIVPLIL